MNRILKAVPKHKWLVTTVLTIALLAAMLIPTARNTVTNNTIELLTRIHDFVLTVGTVEAALEPDFACDGTADDVQLQAALDALPATGGMVYIMEGTYTLTASVARAIDDVSIVGIGKSTYFEYDNGSTIFDAGVQDGWLFRDFATDDGGIDVSTATNWVEYNVFVGSSYTALTSSDGYAAFDATYCSDLEGTGLSITAETLNWAANLNDLSDVNAAAPGDGEVLTWDSGSSKWISSAAADSSAIWDTDADTGIQTEESADEDKIRFDTSRIERGLISETCTETYLKFNKHSDLDGDTIIQVEESSDEDKIRMDVAGIQSFLLSNYGILSLPKQSFVAVSMTANQNIPNATITQVAFDDEDVDIQNEFNTTTHTFTAKELGGYLAIVSVRLSDITDAHYFTVYIASSSVGDANTTVHGSYTAIISATAHSICYLPANGTISIDVYQNTGSTQQLVYLACDLYIVKIT